MGQVFTRIYWTIDQSLPPAPKWSVDDIPNYAGSEKVMLVTGGNTGAGYETAKALLNKNVKVYIACRNVDKANAACAKLMEETGKEAYFLQLDLADLKAVKRAAEEFQRIETRLDVLFNNGGVMNPPLESVTVDGYDLQFGTNVLGHFYLTKLLMPMLIESAKTSSDHKARVVNTSSIAHLFGTLDFDTFRDGPQRRALFSLLGKLRLYGQSKLGNVVFARELARRYGDQGIVSTSLNPGNFRSELYRHNGSLMNRILFPFVHELPLGALTQLRAGTSPEGADWNGKFLIPWAREGECKTEAKDPEPGEKLWMWLEEQVKDL